MGWVESAGPGCCAEPVERGGEVSGPGPALIEAQDEAPAGGAEAGGEVQDAVAEPFGFDLAELAGEAQRLRPDGQVVGGQRELEPGSVGVPVLAGYLECCLTCP